MTLSGFPKCTRFRLLLWSLCLVSSSGSTASTSPNFSPLPHLFWVSVCLGTGSRIIFYVFSGFRVSDLCLRFWLFSGPRSFAQSPVRFSKSPRLLALALSSESLGSQLQPWPPLPSLPLHLVPTLSMCTFLTNHQYNSSIPSVHKKPCFLCRRHHAGPAPLTARKRLHAAVTCMGYAAPLNPVQSMTAKRCPLVHRS